jgi:hypothetical protein
MLLYLSVYIFLLLLCYILTLLCFADHILYIFFFLFPCSLPVSVEMFNILVAHDVVMYNIKDKICCSLTTCFYFVFFFCFCIGFLCCICLFDFFYLFIPILFSLQATYLYPYFICTSFVCFVDILFV